jgi:hypothetical protein
LWSGAIIIERLSREHRNIEKLLAILERELEVFDRRERPDYEVIPTSSKGERSGAKWLNVSMLEKSALPAVQWIRLLA